MIPCDRGLSRVAGRSRDCHVTNNPGVQNGVTSRLSPFDAPVGVFCVSEQRASAERVYLDLVRTYQSAILNYIWRLVGDTDVAEDLTQDTFFKAWRALDRLELGDEAETRQRAWLYRIAHNTAADHLRRKARVRWLSLETLRGIGGGNPAREVEFREPLQRTLDALSDDQRQVLLLFNQHGLSAEEVADVLGISEAAARKRRQRARSAFETAYEQIAGAHGTAGIENTGEAPAGMDMAEGQNEGLKKGLSKANEKSAAASARVLGEGGGKA